MVTEVMSPVVPVAVVIFVAAVHSADVLRALMLAIALASLGTGILVLHRLDAPRPVFTLEAAMVTGLAVGLAITSFWKISIHTAAAAGSLARLATLVSPLWLLLAPLVVLSGWARVQIGAHTPVQGLGGAITGALVTAGVLLRAA